MGTCELTIVTCEIVSASILVMRTLKQLAREEKEKFPLASAALESDFYMDDVFSGAYNLNTAKKLQQKLIDRLSSAGMLLHKH